ncbi:hypothetical protein AB0C20_31790, partial [Micromonospora sp. NPDC048843]
ELRFFTSYEIEQDWDFMFVEAHEVGSDDWTTQLRRGAPAADPERVRAVVAAGPDGSTMAGEVPDVAAEEVAG